MVHSLKAGSGPDNLLLTSILHIEVWMNTEGVLGNLLLSTDYVVTFPLFAVGTLEVWFWFLLPVMLSLFKVSRFPLTPSEASRNANPRNPFLGMNSSFQAFFNITHSMEMYFALGHSNTSMYVIVHTYVHLYLHKTVFTIVFVMHSFPVFLLVSIKKCTQMRYHYKPIIGAKLKKNNKHLL